MKIKNNSTYLNGISSTIMDCKITVPLSEDSHSLIVYFSGQNFNKIVSLSFNNYLEFPFLIKERFEFQKKLDLHSQANIKAKDFLDNYHEDVFAFLEDLNLMYDEKELNENDIFKFSNGIYSQLTKDFKKQISFSINQFFDFYNNEINFIKEKETNIEFDSFDFQSDKVIISKEFGLEISGEKYKSLKNNIRETLLLSEIIVKENHQKLKKRLDDIEYFRTLDYNQYLSSIDKSDSRCLVDFFKTMCLFSKTFNIYL